MNDPRANEVWSMNQSHRSIYHRQVDGNPPYGFGSYNGMPLCATRGGCCLHHHVLQQTSYWNSAAQREQNAYCYGTAPFHYTNLSVSGTLDPTCVFSQPSPVPTVNDCNVDSDSSNDLTSSFSTTHHSGVQSLKYQEDRASLAVQDPSASVHVIEEEAKIDSASSPRVWNHDKESRITDPPRTIGYANNVSSYQVTDGPASTSRRLAALPSPAASFGSEQSRPYGTTGTDHVQPAHATSYPIVQDIYLAGGGATATNKHDAKGKKPKKCKPKNELRETRLAAEKSTLHKTIRSTRSRNARSALRDDFLVRSKMAGMTYKQIKEKGKYAEAESTLRGRFRSLTKSKDKRVRQPRWTDTDVSLLKQAVADLGAEETVRSRGPGADRKELKISWGQVADYIADHGGSYHFGIATCRKKWDEVSKE